MQLVNIRYHTFSPEGFASSNWNNSRVLMLFSTILSNLEYGNLSFDAAINFISNWEIENQSKTVEFVNKLDKKNQGFLDVALLKKVVTSSGSEPLTPAETDELVRILTEKGAVNENGVSIASKYKPPLPGSVSAF